jgi:predicted NAD/FAD-binding protein
MTDADKGKLQAAVDDITLRAALTRIARKADIMRLDAQRGSAARADAEEIALLAGIAMRCLDE